MELYQNATKAEKDRFRSRKSYWRKKGLTEDEAINKAMVVFSSPNGSDDGLDIEKASNCLADRQSLSLVPSINKDEGNTNKLDAQGILTENPFVIANEDHRAQSKTQSAELGSAAFCALIVGIASWLLVDSSLEVFGSGPEGWGKALILELGILGLAVSKSQLGSSLKEMASFLLTRATLIFLVILSFAVLHTGVESQRSENISTAAATNTTLTELVSERDRWQETYDSYSESRVSDRRDAMKEISRLNSEIRDERVAVSQSLGGSVIHLKSNTEMMVRAALLLLNIIFGHKLAAAVATVKWPPLREGTV